MSDFKKLVPEIRLWRWIYTNEQGKRVRSSWLMTEESASHYRDAVKIEETLEVRNSLGYTSDWQRKTPS
jgi:hypothetical protein